MHASNPGGIETVSCRTCLVIGQPDDMVWDVGDEIWLCKRHALAHRLDEVKRARTEKLQWLQKTHLLEVDNMNAEIARLTAELADLDKPSTPIASAP